jgi:hypothetical protein
MIMVRRTKRVIVDPIERRIVAAAGRAAPSTHGTLPYGRMIDGPLVS